MSLFQRPKHTKMNVVKKRNIPSGLWVKCTDCGDMLYRKKLEQNLNVCPKCDYHFSLGSHERIAHFLDENSFKEMFANIRNADPLFFKGPKTYKYKLEMDEKLTGLKTAVIVGVGKVNKIKIAFGVTDSRFIMGSMGSVVGEKLTGLIEYATEHDLPLVIVSGSGGGARMYEGLLSLMQMAKTSAAIAKQHKKGGLFISVLSNPTMAGVLASFASLGDIIIAEPKALIGFTGPRVIEQTIRQKLPQGFQKAEFLLDHGLIDLIVQRKNLRDKISSLIRQLNK